MSDVVAVALVSAGSSLLGASVGAITTYMVSLRSSETAIKTAKGQHKVEMARIEAENERLREQHIEEERRNRQATYHRALTALQRIHGVQADSEDLQEVFREWRSSRSGVQIFGSRKAFKALDLVQEVIKKRPPDDEDRTEWQKELGDAVYVFIDAVREDVKGERPTETAED